MDLLKLNSIEYIK